MSASTDIAVAGFNIFDSFTKVIENNSNPRTAIINAFNTGVTLLSTMMLAAVATGEAVSKGSVRGKSACC